jgi:hypothetical protein
MVKDSKRSYGETAGQQGTVAKGLAGIDEPHGDHSEGGDAGEKEVISAAQLDEVGQIAADEGRVGRGCIALNDESAAAAMIAHEHVFLVAQMRIVAVFDPLLLHELELAGDVRVERHEDDTALFLIGGGFAVCRETSVGKTTAGDATTIDQLAVEAEGIARMDTSNVRPYGTACAVGIGTEGEVCAAAGILSDRGIRSVGAELQGRAISPAADKLSG